MATSKIWGIKGTVSKSIDYVVDNEKTKLQSNLSINQAIGYIGNPQKTHLGNMQLVSGVNGCNPSQASIQFNIDELSYHSQKTETLASGSTPNQAFHLVQCFSSKDTKNTDPDLIHEIGKEFAEKITKGNFKCVVATHMNTAHIHNHIVFCAYAQNGPYKYLDNKETYKRVREINDELCKKYNLEIVIPKDQNHIANYYEWLQIQNGTSWKEQARTDIRSVKEVSSSFSEFKKTLEDAGYEVQVNAKSISYKPPGCSNFVRDVRLGQEYTIDTLNEYWKTINTDIQESKNKIQKDTSITYKNIYRYDETGRRRNDIEYFLLKAINMIKKAISNSITEKSDETIISTSKLQDLINSIECSKTYDINTEADLKERLNEVGMQINTLKNELNEETINRMNKVLNLIDDYNNYNEILESSGIDLEKLKYEKTITSDEKRVALARLEPMTNNQKKVLYQLLETDTLNYKLNYKFDQITSSEAKQIIDFLKGKTETIPDGLLITNEEFNQKRQIKYNDKKANILKSAEKIPPTHSQKITIQEWLDKNGKTLKHPLRNKAEGIILVDYIKNPTGPLPPLLKTERDHYIDKLKENNSDFIEAYLKTQKELAELDLLTLDKQNNFEKKVDRLIDVDFEKQAEIKKLSTKYNELKRIEYNLELAKDLDMELKQDKKTDIKKE